MKKWVAAVVAVAMLVSPGLALAAGLENFVEVKQYQEGTFGDIQPQAWYYQNVVNAYRYGLASGTGDGLFSPEGQVSVAEAVTFAARVADTYRQTGTDFAAAPGRQWYEPYFSYAIEEKIIEVDKFAMAYDRAATRGEVAYIFSRTLPEEEYPCINGQVLSLPDMGAGEAYYSEALLLFRAGVLTGKDEYGSFAPADNITRAEIAAMIDRIIDPAQRKYFIPALQPGQTPAPTATPEPTEVPPMNAEQIAQQAGPSVFYLQIYNQKGQKLKSGSGFFIGEDGTAVTNQHVIDEAYSAKAMLVDGKEYEVSLVYGYDIAKDLAIIQVEGSGFKPLALGDSDQLKSGQKVFCMGSPKGLDNTISEGLVSNPSRELSGTKYFQMSAPISPGSSGGAVLNERCEVVGVSSAGMDDGQNLNFAVPANEIAEVDCSSPKTLVEIYELMNSDTPIDPDNIRPYPENSMIPDFATVTGISYKQRIAREDATTVSYVYPYKANPLEAYYAYLRAQGWTMKSEEQQEGYTIRIYAHKKNGMAVGISVFDNKEYIMLTVPILSMLESGETK